MAHFAQLDENNIVLQVIVVDNKDTSNSNGLELEEIGISFCKKLFGPETIWKKTSYNGSIRKKYAQIGYTYDEKLDAFIPPKPYPSWNLNIQTADWEAPIPKPEITQEQFAYAYFWDEETKQWILKSLTEM